jgi:signal transduction histidine kinase
LAAFAVALIIWLIYHNRVSHLQEIADAKTAFSRQLIESQEAERKRIAAELHDGLGQNLVVIKNRAMLGINKGDDKERVARELNNISESAAQALEEVREITNNLRPQLLDRLGLTKAINAMLKKVSGVINLESEIDSIDGIFNETQEISIYRIVQESLNNIIKHSDASDAIVRIKRDANKVLITIEDNGKGFDVANTKSNNSGLGLVGLKERAQLLNGEFVIDSKIGKGTKIRVAIERKL